MPKPDSSDVEVAAPGDRDRDVADRVLEDQIPADDPRDELAERRVRVRVGAAGLRNHRGELGVAERRRARRRTPSRMNDRMSAGPGAVADDLAARQHFAGRGRADRREDAGADDRADRQHDQIAGAEHALQARAGRCSISARIASSGLTRNRLMRSSPSADAMRAVPRLLVDVQPPDRVVRREHDAAVADRTRRR